MRLSPYMRLMRLHQPVGIWLLLWPCWWAVALASPGLPPLVPLLLFGLGAIVMRSAGCIINDIADRKFDAQVERTRNRPLASGELAVWQAVSLLVLLLIIAAAIVSQLGWHVLMWGVLSLVPVVIYPFMKRISWWPQLFLGFTFNWGALMGWVAIRSEVELPALALYIGGIFWTLGYDTIYAHQDKKDDAQIGVKSTALRLGVNTKKMVGLFYLLASLCWALAGWSANASLLFFAFLILAQLHLRWQLCSVSLDEPVSCRRIFVSNVWLGAILCIGCILAHFQNLY